MWLKEGQGQNSTQRTSRWQVKQGQHKLIMAKMVGQANTMLFVGYFPADNPKFSCIVVVHKPSTW
jgi:cell division protein FtsI (penicillin-binding protein 3)